jgi:hypothetical protein
MWNAQMIQALQAGTIDAAVSLCPEVGSGVESDPVRSEPVVLVAPTSKPPPLGAREGCARHTRRPNIPPLPARARSPAPRRARRRLPSGRVRAQDSERVVPNELGPRPLLRELGRRARPELGRHRSRGRSHSDAAERARTPARDAFVLAIRRSLAGAPGVSLHCANHLLKPCHGPN